MDGLVPLLQNEIVHTSQRISSHELEQKVPLFSIFNMASSAIGAGVLAFPFAFRQAGALGGLLVTLGIAVVEIGALSILTRAASSHRAHSYQELVHKALGPGAAGAVAATIFAYCFGSCVAYLIIISDVFQPAAAGLFGTTSFLASRSVVLCTFSLLVILPLAWKRTLRSLSFSSALSFFTLLYLALAILACGSLQLVSKGGVPAEVQLFGTTVKGYFSAMAIVVFAFHCHIQVVPIFSELIDYRAKQSVVEASVQASTIACGRSSNGHVAAMDKVILIALGTCLLAYSLVGEFGYLAFPGVRSDVLSSFHPTNKAMALARLGMGLVAIVAYPINHFPARLVAESALSQIWQSGSGSSSSSARHGVLTLSYLAGTLSVALNVHELGKVYEVVGSTAGVVVIFFIPSCLMYQRSGLFTSVVGQSQLSSSSSASGGELSESRDPQRGALRTVAGLTLASVMMLLGALIFGVSIWSVAFSGK